MRRDRKLQLSQGKYAQDMLIGFQMLYSGLVNTPAEDSRVLPREISKSNKINVEITQIPCQGAIGSLMYLIFGTRPDSVLWLKNQLSFPKHPRQHTRVLFNVCFHMLKEMVI